MLASFYDFIALENTLAYQAVELITDVIGFMI